MNKRTNIKDFARRTTMTLLLALVTTAAAWAQDNVSYRAYNTSTHQFENGVAASPTAVTAGTTVMSGGWYVVSSNVTVSDRIEVTGTVNLILCDGKTLTATQGLHVPTGVTLNIYGQSGGTGGLTATQGGSDQAGIGGNSGEVSGSITIHGGNVTSTGGWSGAGIGGGHDRPCGSITIYGGTVNAHGGDRAAGIGGGTGEYSGGTITIMGGTVTAWANNLSNVYDNSQAIGVGLSSNPGTCTLFLGDVKVYNSANATTPVASTDRESTCRSKYVRLMPCDHHYVNDECTYCGADEYYAPRQYLAYETASQSFVLRSAYEFTYVMSNITTMGTDGSEKYYVVKNDVSIGSRIEVRGTVHLILCDGKTLTASKGITVNNGNTLNIYGQSGGTGTLNAYGTGSNGGESAAIGSTGHTTVGNITIHGGRINADGASWSAGIGGGVSAGGGSVKIYGGTVDATGHNGTSEAIGRGSSGSSVSKTIADGLRVIVDGNTVAYSQRVSKLNSSDSDIRDTRQAVVEPCTHVGSGNRCQYCNASIYHVTYNNNDATSGTVPTDANYESGQTVTVPGNTGNLERTGYLFIGWNTEADGSGVSYPEGATFVIRDNITLYADWSSILELAGNADNSSAISAAAADGKQHRVVLDGYTLYRDGTWNTLVLPFNLATLDGTPLEGFTVKTLASSANNNGLLTMTFSDATTIEAGKPYIVKREADLVIRTTDDWITFAYNVNNGNDYQGKVVKLAADISVTTMVGAPNNSSTSSLDGAYPFSGTFDGNGHTLTITYSNTEQHTAPFRCVNGATIKNLHVAGSITTSAKFAAGVVGRAFGSTTVTNCRSSVEITSTVSGDGTHAGLVAIVAAYSTDNLTMEGCLFDGKLLGASTSHCGGLVGYRYAGSGAVSISNSLFAPSQVTVSGTSSAVLCRDEGTGSYTNCYYTYQLGTAQGTNASSMSNETLVSYLCDGWEISNSKVVPKMENSIADIVNLVFEDVLISAATANVSTTYADFIGSYAPITDATLLLDSHNPDGDAMHAALKAKREGYTFEGCYSDAALTTPVTTIPFAADGTVTLYIKVSTPLNYTITYNLNGGTNHASNPDTYNIESATITLQAPDKTGYSFGGWFDNEDCTGNAVTSIATGSYGDMTLYAKWLTEELELANNGDNSDAISTAAASGLYHNVTLADRTIYKDGDWNTLCLPFSLASLTGTPLEGLTVKTLESTTFNDGTLTMNFSDDLTSIEAGKPYIVKNDNADLIIRSAADWSTFATNVNNGTDNYQGKLVKLAADISVSTMVGDQSHPFKGTFDGCGHTLTFNYTTDADNAAPFQWIMNAVIKNLKVMGEIRSSQMFAAGFVARAYGDNAIENCVSSVTIHATKVGDGTHGGFVGRIESDCKTFTFTDCKFNGTFDGSNTDNWCPFAAWSMGNDNTHFTFNNCLYAPASTNVRGGCATFYRNGTATLNGAYYTQAIGTVQGTDASGMSAEVIATALGDGWQVSGGNVVPKMNSVVYLVIRTAADWNTFANNVNNGNDYQGKVVKLAADISVTTMVGDESHPFKGTFDGCGYTLTFNYTTDADNAAPFQWIMNAVIKNLKVMGEIRSSQMFAAGFVARAYGDNAIENCVSSVTIHATKVGDGTHGGFVGRIESDCKTFTFTDCKFNGTFDGSNTDNWCPFAAWSMGNDNTHFTFNNCLYAPASANVRGGCATFYRNGTATLNGAYYTQAIGTAQGTNANGMSNETLVGYLGSGWEISNDQVVPKMINSVDNIVNPVFSNVLISDVTANVSTTYADFIGNFSSVILTGGDKSVLYLGTHNQLYYPAANRIINACRAYFQLNGLTVGGPASGPSEIKAFVLNFGDEDDPDSLTPNPSPGRGEQDDTWYSLDGKKLSGKPSQKGIYVNNGRKVVLK